MELLFIMAHWHALAKLRMHNDCTLDVMQTVTVSLGDKLRRFSQVTCSAFATKELRREYNARVRREARTAAKKSHGTAGASNPTNQASPTEMDPSDSLLVVNDPPRIRRQRLKTFNLNTFKCHSLGDYVNTIRQYGTSDSYSTEPVRVQCLSFGLQLIHMKGELEHRSSKARYARTSRKGFIRQMTQIERRQARIRRIRASHRRVGNSSDKDNARSPEVHHIIGKSQNFHENIPLFLEKNRHDPAVKVTLIYTFINIPT